MLSIIITIRIKSLCLYSDQPILQVSFFSRTPNTQTTGDIQTNGCNEEPFYHVYQDVEDSLERINDEIQNKQTILNANTDVDEMSSEWETCTTESDVTDMAEIPSVMGNIDDNRLVTAEIQTGWQAGHVCRKSVTYVKTKGQQNGNAGKFEMPRLEPISGGVIRYKNEKMVIREDGGYSIPRLEGTI